MDGYSVREAWLTTGLAVLRRELFRPKGIEIPEEVRVSVGFPHGRGKQTIGQCWSDRQSADKHFEIFIHPSLSEPARVLDVLVHEAIHTLVPGHPAAFKKIAVTVGLEGKMTQTVASNGLKTWLTELLADLGTFPHASLSTERPEDLPKKQTTRMLKAACPECGYTVRLSQKWVDAGYPICPCNGESMKGA